MTTTLAAITARAATQRRCFASLAVKASAAAISFSRNYDSPSRRAGVGAMPSGATEILISTPAAKSSDVPTSTSTRGLGSRRPLACTQTPPMRASGAFAYPSASRNFSSTAASSGADDSNLCHDRPPVTSFSEDELMVRDLCRQWGDEVLRPVVRDMDEEGRTYPEIIQGLFDCGLMGMVRQNVLCCCHMTCFFAKCTLSVRR